MSIPSSARPAVTSAGPLGGVAVGLALVLLAVVIGVIGERSTGPRFDDAAAAMTEVNATGNTTTVEVVAEGMRFKPDHVEVPAGDRLVIEVTNLDQRRHDLVLANGARTPTIAPGGTAHLDAGVIGSALEGWCSLSGHRQAGMVFGIAVLDESHESDSESAPDGMRHEPAPRVDAMADPGEGFTARPAAVPTVSHGRVHRVTLRVQEVDREVAPGVRQQLWTYNGTAPGPVLRGKVGDVFEVTLINDGTIDHAIDFHASALAPDRPMRPIEPGEHLVYRFTATKAGIWMYHCATEPMLHHIGNGMYGAVIIDPPDLAEVDREYVLVQSELYLGGDGEPGDLAKMKHEQPDAVVFNGYVSQYAHRPLTAAAGERVRIWVLNVGPSRHSAFHVVGTRFDTVYREGSLMLQPSDPGGAQVLDLAPAAGGFVEMVFPEPGRYPFLSHVMVDADRGARGAFTVIR
ncbi:MAG TPA: multicopper oxidase domain-containing protein [Jiangellaceae bacterium]